MFKSLRQTFSRPVFKLMFGVKNRDLFKLLLISLPGFFAALFEGASFALIILALRIFNGTPVPQFTSYPLLKFLASFSVKKFFFFTVLCAIVLQIFRSFFILLSKYGGASFATKIQSRIRRIIAKKVLCFDFPTVSLYSSGQLSYYMNDAPSSVFIFLTSLSNAVTSYMMSLMMVCFLFYLSSSLTVLCVVLFSVFYFTHRFFFKKILNVSGQCSEELKKYTSELVQGLHGMRLIHTFSKQESFYEKMKKIIAGSAGFQKKDNLLQGCLQAVNEVAGMVLISTILVASYIFFSSGENLLTTLLSFIIVSYRMVGIVQVGGSHFGAAAGNFGHLLSIDEILKNKDHQFEEKKGKVFKQIKSCIKMDRVSFQYSSKKVDVIKDFSLEFTKGQMTAIVGLSGSGKSSLIDLIIRLYQPTSGAILVDGRKLDDYTVKSWREKLGVVSQDSFVFDDTIENNISFGDKVSKKALHAAAAAAGCLEFIQVLPKGFQTVLGEKGFRLSGGEKQRLSLARALIKQPEILILDEATSNLDSHSEKLIQEALHIFGKNRTIILVAHRLSTVVNADKIVVMEAGKIVEQGTHASLTKDGGAYSYFWQLQKQHQQKEASVV